MIKTLLSTLYIGMVFERNLSTLTRSASRHFRIAPEATSTVFTWVGNYKPCSDISVDETVIVYGMKCNRAILLLS